METRLFSITGEIRSEKAQKGRKTGPGVLFMAKQSREGRRARAKTDVFENLETEAKELLQMGYGETGFMTKKRRESGLGAIKADVVENLKIGNRMRVYMDLKTFIMSLWYSYATVLVQN